MSKRWIGIYGQPPPKGTSRRLLERAEAYQLQVAAIGGMPPELCRRLARLSQTEDQTPEALHRQKPAARLSPGTRFVREWNGHIHTVEAADNGFLWNGRNWPSLSAVAKAITGARWSGPRFFGL